MINLKKLREWCLKQDYIADHLLWCQMIAPGVIKHKDGGLQVTFRYRGPDLSNATQIEMMNISARLNNALKRLGDGWAIYAEAQRFQSKSYETSDYFPDPITREIDRIRAKHFSKGLHFESAYYFTLIYLPPKDHESRIREFMMEGEEDGASGLEYYKDFLSEADKIYQLMATILPEADLLDEEETLTYLHSTVSPKRHRVVPPPIPMYLDSYIYDSDFEGGWKPVLGGHHMRVVSILSFPGSSIPGILDSLNALPFEYRWVTRMICLDPLNAKKETSRYEKLFYADRKSMADLARETLTGVETTRFNQDALKNAEDAAEAGMEVTDDWVSFGYYTMSVVLLDQNEKKVIDNASKVEKIINGLGFTAINETYNAVEAYFGSIPGMCRSNVRKPIISTRNLSDLLPISATWAGPEWNKHLNGPVLLMTETIGNTPFRFDPYVGDVAHTMVIGPTGAGKSVLLNLMAAQARKYRDARVIIFDQGASSRVLTYGVGGRLFELAQESQELSFQPLAGIHEEKERTWALEWLENFYEIQNKNPDNSLSSGDREDIWKTLTLVAELPVEQRDLSAFYINLNSRNKELAGAFHPLTKEGAYGSLFDSRETNLSMESWQVFEMEKLMHSRTAVAPTLLYIFHEIEKALNGDPTFIFLDECWIYLDTHLFAGKIREWLKTFRKKNCAVIFATQSITDVAASTIAPAILDSCGTRVFLPNHNALEPASLESYQFFGLNSTEIRIISEGVKKQDYFVKSQSGARLIQLALDPFQLAYCGSSNKTDQKEAIRILREYGKDEFNLHWMKYKNLQNHMNILNASL